MKRQESGAGGLTSTRKWSLTFACIIAVLVPTLSFSQDYDDSEVDDRMPASVGALGDSMTAAALAGYKRSESIFPWIQIGILVQGIMFGITKNIHNVEHRKYSWSTGNRIPSRSMPSHWERLSEMEGRDLPFYNASLSGAESDHVLNTQVGDLRNWSRQKLHREFPDYVTILIGANDLCANSTDEMISTEDFFSNVMQSVHQIVSTSPDTKILISSLPNVVKLRDVAKDAKDFGAFSCEAIWKKVSLCKTLTTISDPESRYIVQARLEQYNQALKEVSVREREQYGDRIRFAKQLYEADFDPKDLALDCFHPNKDGQAKVAEKTFQASWWKNQWAEKRQELKEEFLAQKKRDCPPPSGKGAYRPSICYESWKDPQ